MLNCACVAAWGSTVVRFISAARVLDRFGLKADNCEPPAPSEENPDELVVLLSIEGFGFILGFAAEARCGFAGVLVGERDTGRAKAADTFLLVGKGFEGGTDTTAFFTGEVGVGI